MKRLLSTMNNMMFNLNLKKLTKTLALGIGSLGIIFSTLSSPAKSQTACRDVDGRTGVSAINSMLSRIRPQLHLNQVDEAAKARNEREIYLPGDNWASLDIDGTTRRLALDDFPPTDVYVVLITYKILIPVVFLLYLHGMAYVYA